MPSIIFKLTQAGRAALVNAQNTGTQARTVVSVGVTATAFTPTDALTAIPAEIKRIGTLAGDVVDAGTVHVTVRDDGTDSYTVRGLGLWLDNGVLLGTYSQAEPIVEKSRASIMLLACDLRVLDGGVDISTLIFGNKDFLNPPATTERQGVVELATEAEADALEDAQRAVAPRSLRGLFARAALAARLIVAGTGLKGGGNLYGDRTISLADTPVTPGQYGSASAVPSFVVDAQGRINYAGTVGVAAPWAGITGLPRWLLSERGFVSMDAENVDFNDVQEPGMYQTGGPRRLAKNSPPAYPFGLLLVLGVAWGPRTQLYFSHEGQQLYRTKYNDSDWSPWKRAAILGDDATFKDLKAATFAGDGYGLSGLRWRNLIERPTTLGGYGITDAAASARRIVAGTGLAGGGDLAEDRTLSLANTPVTPGQYGSASAVPSFVVDAQGRITYAGAFSVAAPWAGITGMPRWVMHDKGFVEMGDDSRDFNDVTEPGTYKTGGERSTTKNRPPAYPYGVLMVLGAESGPRTQLYFSHEGEMLYRTKYNAQDWSSWMRPALGGMDATFKNLTAQATLRGAELRIGEDGATATGLLKKSGGALQLDTWGAAAPLRLGGSAVEFKTETGSAVETRHWADQRFYGDAKTVYGPNTTWAGKLIVGAGDWITTADDAAALAGTNGNVHLDPAKGRKVHLNFYRGAGVVIGNGAMGTVAEITPSGYAWFGGRVDADGVAARGDSRVMAGPNSQGRYLALGGNGVEGIDRSNTGSVLVSVGNLHIDPAGGYATYMNWYSGKGVIFGNGAGAQCASIDENGHATVEGLTVAGCTGGVVPPGTIIQYAGHNAPVGYLRANGAAVSRTTYAALFAAIGTTHGAGDGSTTFNLPDRRGVFMRGVDDGRGIDPGRALGSFQGSQNAAHGHSATVHENGWHGHGASASGVGDHVHNMTFRPYQWDHGITGEVGDNGDPNYGAQVTSGTMQGAGAHGHTIWIEGSGTHTHGISIGIDGGNESRPINAADLFCIKY